MCHHPVRGADARWLRLVIPKEKFAHFHKRELILAQRHQCFFHLIKRGDQAAQVSTGLERGAHLTCVIIRIWHIQKEGIHVCFVEALLDVAQLEVYA